MKVIAGNWVGVKSLLVVLVVGAEAVFAGLNSGGSSEARSGYVPGEVLIKLKDGSHSLVRMESMAGRTHSDAFVRLLAKYGLREGPEVQDSNQVYQRDVLKERRFSLLKTDRPILALCAELRKDPDVAMAQPNYIYHPCREPNDPDFADQYAHQLIQMPDAWDISTGSHDVVVAIIDTGVDVNHPDLKDNIWVNADEIPNNGLDDDRNGYVDDIQGWNFGGSNNKVRPESSPFSDSIESHGTQVAGVIAAVGDNGKGVAGVNWHCSIMPLRLSLDFTSAEVADALDYAAANGARIVNMSFGSDDFGPDGDPIVMEAIDHAFGQGVLLVASAGNSDTVKPNYPAAYYCVMAVASTNGEDLKTGHSSFGPWVDIAAPGTDIVTTDLNGGYISTAGTSFSSPYVVAVAALLFSHRPELTAIEARAILEDTTDPVDYGSLNPDTCYIGTGRVNAFQAMLAAGQRHPLGEIVEPRQGQTFASDVNAIPLILFVHGDSYKVEIRTFGDNSWTMISQGACSADPNGLIRLSLANPGVSAYDLRLSVTTEGRTHTDFKTFGIELGSNKAPWPMPGVTEYPPEEMFYTSPICMDVDGDGRNEIIQSSITLSGYWPDSRINIWDQDGNPLPGWPREMALSLVPSVAVGDIDGDGDYEVVAASDDENVIYAWHAENGQPVAGPWPVSVGYWFGAIYANPVLADLDGDGDSEILVVLNGESAESDGLFAIQADGTFLWQRRYTSEGAISVADLNGDAKVEIALCGFGPGITRVYTFILDNQGQLIKKWKGGSMKGTAIADLDADGKQEVVFCTEDSIQAVRVDGSTVWTTKINEPFDTAGAISIGDINGDGLMEVYVNSYVEADGFAFSHVYAFDHRGRLLTDAGYPKTVMGDPECMTPLIGDIDGDGQKELTVASANAPVMAWEQDGSASPGFPMLGLSAAILSVPALSDLDHDGDLEIMVGGVDYRFHVLDLPGRYAPNLIDWGMSRHDPQCSGWTSKAIILGPISVPAQIGPGERLQMKLTAENPDNKPLHFSAGNLPEGAYFDKATHTVFWKPTADQAFYTFTFSFLVTDGIRQDSRSVSIAVIPDAIYYANMDTDPGWQLDEGWAWGVPTGKGSWNGDPNSGHTGKSVIGYALAGDYDNNLKQTRYATTGAIDCGAYRNIRLSFWRWLGIESPYDKADIQVSIDGQTWVDLWTTGSAHISDKTWQFEEYAVPAAVADQQSKVYFRWGMGPSDDSVVYPGWNIDDVIVTGKRVD